MQILLHGACWPLLKHQSENMMTLSRLVHVIHMHNFWQCGSVCLELPFPFFFFFFWFAFLASTSLICPTKISMSLMISLRISCKERRRKSFPYSSSVIFCYTYILLKKSAIVYWHIKHSFEHKRTLTVFLSSSACDRGVDRVSSLKGSSSSSSGTCSSGSEMSSPIWTRETDFNIVIDNQCSSCLSPVTHSP